MPNRGEFDSVARQTSIDQRSTSKFNELFLSNRTMEKIFRLDLTSLVSEFNRRQAAARLKVSFDDNLWTVCPDGTSFVDENQLFFSHFVFSRQTAKVFVHRTTRRVVGQTIVRPTGFVVLSIRSTGNDPSKFEVRHNSIRPTVRRHFSRFSVPVCRIDIVSSQSHSFLFSGNRRHIDVSRRYDMLPIV